MTPDYEAMYEREKEFTAELVKRTNRLDEENFNTRVSLECKEIIIKALCERILKLTQGEG
jgi:hypothetical protein